MVEINTLRAKRTKLHYSQLELSIVAGVSPAMVVAIERYLYVPSTEVRTKLAKALNTSEVRIWPSLAEAVEAENVK